jgi:hypothetical protein
MVILLGIFKLVAAAVAAFFAGYGLLHDFRRDGKVTPEGKIALYGGIIAGLLTVTSQLLETLKQRSDDRKAETKYAQQVEISNQLMTQILRGVYPLKDVTFDVSFDFTPSDADSSDDIDAYKQRLDHEVAAILKIRRFTKNETAITDANTNQPVAVALKDGSRLLPKEKESEEIPWIALTKFRYNFAFYSNASDEKSIGLRHPNLSFSVVPDRRDFGAGLSSMFQIDTYHAGVTSFWNDDGTIGSLKDLSNVIGTFYMSPSSPSPSVENVTRAQRLLLRSSSIRGITMHVGAKDCVINSYELKKREAPALGWWFRFGNDTLKNCSVR